MIPFFVIELKVCGHTSTRFKDRPVTAQVNIFVFDRAPQPLHENVVQTAAPTVHADADLAFGQLDDKLRAGELRALIGVEYRRRRVMTQGVLERFNTEARIEGVGQPPTQNTATVPVDDGHQIHKPFGQTDVGDVRAPDLVGMRDFHIP